MDLELGTRQLGSSLNNKAVPRKGPGIKQIRIYNHQQHGSKKGSTIKSFTSLNLHTTTNKLVPRKDLDNVGSSLNDQLIFNVKKGCLPQKEACQGD